MMQSMIIKGDFTPDAIDISMMVMLMTMLAAAAVYDNDAGDDDDDDGVNFTPAAIDIS